jgi:hypothetical protein
MVCLLGLLVLVTGCSSGGPLFTGRLETGRYWKNPLSASNNEGAEFEKGSRVEVYSQFILVTAPNGLSRVLPHGYYSELLIRKD